MNSDSRSTQRKAYRPDYDAATGKQWRVHLAVPLSEDFLSSILITAFDADYGGCWYWAEPYGDDAWDIDSVKTGDDALWRSVRVKLREPCGKESVDTTAGSFGLLCDYRALESGLLFAIGRNGVNHVIRDSIFRGVVEDDAGEIDAIGADVIVQMGLFHELIYG